MIFERLKCVCKRYQIYLCRRKLQIFVTWSEQVSGVETMYKRKGASS